MRGAWWVHPLRACVHGVTVDSSSARTGNRGATGPPGEGGTGLGLVIYEGGLRLGCSYLNW